MADYGHVDDSPTIITATISSDSTVGTIVMPSKNIKYKSFSYIRPITKSNTTTTLSQARMSMGTATLKNYALFITGIAMYSISSVTDAYDNKLVRTTAYSINRANITTAKIQDEYVVVAGGTPNGSTILSTVQALDSSLVAQTLVSLNQQKYACAGASIGNYAVIAGGYADLYSMQVESYDASFLHSNHSNLDVHSARLSGGYINNHIMFAGGFNDRTSRCVNNVNIYNSALVKQTSTTLATARYDIAVANTPNYIFFTGGYLNTESPYYTNTVDIFNNALSKTTVILPTIVSKAASVSTGNYALFASGATDGSNSDKVFTFDDSLLRTDLPSLHKPLINSGAAKTGNYILIGGGAILNAGCSDILEIYEC